MYTLILASLSSLHGLFSSLLLGVHLLFFSISFLCVAGEVFSDTQQLIRSVLDGYNVCIFAYGQTGSGKTFTMVRQKEIHIYNYNHIFPLLCAKKLYIYNQTGPKDLTEQSRGVNYRALGDLFLLAEQRKDTFFYEVSVQMIEIYNEQVRDLLVSDGVHKRYPSKFL